MTSPLVGSSRLPAIVSRVDLPEPDGPITATKWPSSTDRSMPSRALDGGLAFAVGLRHLAELEQAHRVATILRWHGRQLVP